MEGIQPVDSSLKDGLKTHTDNSPIKAKTWLTIRSYSPAISLSQFSKFLILLEFLRFGGKCKAMGEHGRQTSRELKPNWHLYLDGSRLTLTRWSQTQHHQRTFCNLAWIPEFLKFTMVLILYLVTMEHWNSTQMSFVDPTHHIYFNCFTVLSRNMGIKWAALNVNTRDISPNMNMAISHYLSIKSVWSMPNLFLHDAILKKRLKNESSLNKPGKAFWRRWYLGYDSEQ